MVSPHLGMLKGEGQGGAFYFSTMSGIRTFTSPRNAFMQIRKGQRKPYGRGSRESGGSGGQGPILICIPVLVPLPE